MHYLLSLLPDEKYLKQSKLSLHIYFDWHYLMIKLFTIKLKIELWKNLLYIRKLQKSCRSDPYENLKSITTESPFSGCSDIPFQNPVGHSWHLFYEKEGYAV